MANFALLTLLVIVLASAPVLLLIWIDRLRGKRGTTSRATSWLAGIIVVWIILDTFAMLIPAYRASALSD